MKVTRKSNLLAVATLVSAAAFTSCNVNDYIEDETNRPVRFTASIDNQAIASAPEARAAGSTWSNNDAIGIFMVETGTLDIAENATNKQYTTSSGNGSFTAATLADEIFYPMDGGSDVNFIAYYPYRSGATLTTAANIEIATAQTAANQPTYDLLWSGSATDYNKTSSNVPLTFQHKLSKIVMNVSAHANVGASAADLSGMTVTITGMNTKNTINLATGDLNTPSEEADITPRTITAGSQYDAIIIPGDYAAGAVSVEFTVNSETFTWNVGAKSFASGSEYTYDVTLTRTGVVVTGTITPWTSVTGGSVTAE
jgi:hypothetical protein